MAELTVDNWRTKPRKTVKRTAIQRYLDNVVNRNGGWKALIRKQVERALNDKFPQSHQLAENLIDRRFGKATQVVDSTTTTVKTVTHTLNIQALPVEKRLKIVELLSDDNTQHGTEVKA